MRWLLGRLGRLAGYFAQALYARTDQDSKLPMG